MQITPIARIKTDFSEKFGIPRQSGRAKSLTATIIFEPQFRNDDSLRGIEGFSHLWLIFDFSKAHLQEYSPTVRPPRLGGNTRIGVFASRSPFRPNSLGLSSVKLLEVRKTQNEGTVLIVGGADLLDGTPIYDVKPYLPSTDCHVDATSGYAGQFTDYKLDVKIDQKLKDKIPSDKIDALIECLAEDPRPSYHDDDREYGMKFSSLNVKFKVKDGTLYVLDIE